MKTVYREHEIDVFRDKCLGGWSMLYFSVFRLSDKLEIISGFEDSRDSIKSKVESLKGDVDETIEHPELYED